MKNYVNIKLSAISENENFARNTVAAFALPLNPTISELSDIKTAVSEAVTNSIVHAYKGKGGFVEIECETDGDETGGKLHIRITDTGCGIPDVNKAIEPFYTTLPGEERSGMGFTIMQTFMTEFKVESKSGQGTTVDMIKEIGEKKETANA